MNPAAYDLARARVAELTADAERIRVTRQVRGQRRDARRAARQAATQARS